LTAKNHEIGASNLSLHDEIKKLTAKGDADAVVSSLATFAQN